MDPNCSYVDQLQSCSVSLPAGLRSGSSISVAYKNYQKSDCRSNDVCSCGSGPSCNSGSESFSVSANGVTQRNIGSWRSWYQASCKDGYYDDSSIGGYLLAQVSGLTVGSTVVTVSRRFMQGSGSSCGSGESGDGGGCSYYTVGSGYARYWVTVNY